MTNGAAIGYALLAGMQIGLTKEQLLRLQLALWSEMDLTCEEEAEEYYKKFGG